MSKRYPASITCIDCGAPASVFLPGGAFCEPCINARVAEHLMNHIVAAAEAAADEQARQSNPDQPEQTGEQTGEEEES